MTLTEEDLIGYVLDLLDPTERAAIGAHLLTHPADVARADRARAALSPLSADRASLGPGLAKHGSRIGSALMLLIDGDRRIVAGTLAAEIGKRFGPSKLLDRASAAQQATALVSFGGQLYQLVVVPVFCSCTVPAKIASVFRPPMR